MRQLYILLLLVLAPATIQAIQVQGNVTQPHCGFANGSINAWVTGGQAPYTWLWTPAPPNGQGTPGISGVGPGLWSVTVTDALSAEATADFTLVNQPYLPNLELAYTWGYNGSAAHHPCPGFQNGSICAVTSMFPGTPPYTVTLNGQPPLGYDLTTSEPYFGYFGVSDQVYLEVTDATGCEGSTQVLNDSPQSLGAMASNINPACGVVPNGSCELYFGFAGPYGPFLQVWDDLGNFVVNETPMMEPLQLTGLAGGSYTIYGQYSPVYFAGPGCDYNGNFTIPDLGTDCGSVSGHLYIDNNQDCDQDAGEPNVPYHVIEINPGPEYAITNAAGDYTRNLVNGNFDLQAQGTGVDLYPICPALQPAPFTIDFNNVTVDLADSSLVPLDVQLMAHSSVARPGFVHQIWGSIRNLTAQVSGAVTLTLTYDPQMGYVSANPAPSSIAGTTLTWDLPALVAYAEYNFSVQLMVPANTGLIGLPFAHSANAAQPLTESTYLNNAPVISGVFQGSYDPNDKIVRTSSGYSDTQYFIGTDEYLDYTIRFQNTGTDTAFTVVVTDTLSPLLDMSSFQQGAASHPFAIGFKPGRVVEWRFENILLPDSNVNEAASHGMVGFRIRPLEPLLPGTVLSNNADIFFDFNDPIRTPDAVVIAETSTGSDEQDGDALRVYPNPAHDRIRVVHPDPAVAYEQVLILSMDGREVLRQATQDPISEISVGTLRAGTYLLELRTSDARIQRAIFVKE